MKQKITVIPLVQVGKIRFGMKRDEVRQVMGAGFTEFRKTKFSKNTSDDYGYIHVFYNSENECIAVEVFNDCEITIDNTVLPAEPVAFNNWLRQHDKDAEISGDYATSLKLSIGMSALDGIVESVLFGNAGYYNP